MALEGANGRLFAANDELKRLDGETTAAKNRLAETNGVLTATNSQLSTTNALLEQEIWNFLYKQAQASRRSPGSGRRFDTLDSLNALRQHPGYRDGVAPLRAEAVACLALTDLRRARGRVARLPGRRLRHGFRRQPGALRLRRPVWACHRPPHGRRRRDRLDLHRLRRPLAGGVEPRRPIPGRPARRPQRTVAGLGPGRGGGSAADPADRRTKLGRFCRFHARQPARGGRIRQRVDRLL